MKIFGANMERGKKTMSKALKCDRCGTLYEYNFQLYLNPYFVGKDCHSYEDKRLLDLCPNCQKMLVEWFKDGERKKTE